MSDEQDYRNFIKKSTKNFDEQTNIDQSKIIRKSRQQAMTTNILISLAVLLLITPILTLTTHFYYATGDDVGRADKQIQIATDVIEVTEPNMYVKRMDLEESIDLFSMDLNFDVFKRIGKEEYRVGEYDINYTLNQPQFPDRSLLLDRPHPEIPQIENASNFVHPSRSVPIRYDNEWDMVEALPDGTVVEAYVSFTDQMNPDEINEINPGLDPDIDFLWLAVDTGIEATQVDDEGLPVTPIGYPVYDEPPTWSPFDNREANEDVFLDILKNLEKHEEQATTNARAKTLVLEERIEYIEANGTQIYGAVVTGPASEIQKLQDNEQIRSLKVGEVKLWNWQ